MVTQLGAGTGTAISRQELTHLSRSCLILLYSILLSSQNSAGSCVVESGSLVLGSLIVSAGAMEQLFWCCSRRLRGFHTDAVNPLCLHDGKKLERGFITAYEMQAQPGTKRAGTENYSKGKACCFRKYSLKLSRIPN